MFIGVVLFYYPGEGIEKKSEDRKAPRSEGMGLEESLCALMLMGTFSILFRLNLTFPAMQCNIHMTGNPQVAREIATLCTQGHMDSAAGV